jgi:hypothetical protein
MSINLSQFLAMTPADRITYFHDTLVQSELLALRKEASAAKGDGPAIFIADAMEGALKLVAADAQVAAYAAAKSVEATFYTRLAGG